MIPKLLELRPDRNLLNPDFNGYKLSLEKIPVLRKDFEVSVDRVLPNSEQYSLLHVKLFGLHNHLFTDHFHGNVYFVDKLWNVQKVQLDTTGQLKELETVWKIPVQSERKPGHYNISLQFTTDTVAVVSDGTGVLHIVNTGNRAGNQKWDLLFSDEVLGGDKSFIIQDSTWKVDKARTELHCLLVNIERAETGDKFLTVINWITLSQSNDSKWGQVSLRVLKAPGGFYYCALEPDCKYLYVASDQSFKFILDSENPVVDKPDPKPKPSKIYTWLQAPNDITLRFNIPNSCKLPDFSITTSATTLQIHYKEICLLSGDFCNNVDGSLTTWKVENNVLEVTLVKAEKDSTWNELLEGDESGEQIFDASVVAQVHEGLAHLCSETEVIPVETGPAFSTQQIEECDDTENTAIFERIFSTSHDVTHRANLGSHQVIMTVALHPRIPPSLVIRHDVDACLWTPQEEDNESWSLTHEGTLLAFGYVQASKQQRKFLSCSPDLSYSVICESTRHVFVYRQDQMVKSGELRNRKSGQRVDTVAQQQVVSLSDDEILGLSANNDILYVLTEHYILGLKI